MFKTYDLKIITTYVSMQSQKYTIQNILAYKNILFNSIDKKGYLKPSSMFSVSICIYKKKILRVSCNIKKACDHLKLLKRMDICLAGNLKGDSVIVQTCFTTPTQGHSLVLNLLTQSELIIFAFRSVEYAHYNFIWSILCSEFQCSR